MFERILPQIWLLAPREIREHLAQVFEVPRSSIIEVRDQTVVSDGRTLEDLAVITAERMAEYVGSMEPFARLWELTLAKAHSELNPPVGMIVSHEAQEELPAKPKRNAKKASK